MTPIKEVVPGFDLSEEMVIYAKNQPEYLQLPCHKQPDGTLTIRWKLTWTERFKIFFTGSLWHQILTFNRPLQPQKLHTNCPIIGSYMLDKEV